MPTPISHVKTLENAPFILTGSKDGEATIWNTDLNLIKAADLKFKEIGDVPFKELE